MKEVIDKYLCRAKNIDDEWIYGYVTPFAFDVDDIKMCITFVDENNRFNAHQIDVATICRYTGLKDCEGNKIFEGDILLDRDEQVAGIVQADTDASGFGISLENTWFNGEIFADLEIVGNIINDPEMLEEPKDNEDN